LSTTSASRVGLGTASAGVQVGAGNGLLGVDPHLDEVLHDLVAGAVDEVDGDQRRRLERAEADLRRCVEVHDAAPSDARELESLAVAPTTSTVLLEALPAFLERAPCAGNDDEDRRVRLRLALLLGRALLRQPGLSSDDVASASERLDRAWRAALQRLREDQAQRLPVRRLPLRR
jgi:hypothetical protein